MNLATAAEGAALRKDATAPGGPWLLPQPLDFHYASASTGGKFSQPELEGEGSGIPGPGAPQGKASAVGRQPGRSGESI